MRTCAKIISNFMSVSGVHEKYIKDEVITNPQILVSNITSDYELFYSSDLKNAFYKEVNHYLDKALYQYILSKSLSGVGKLSWGAVSQYYSNFFTICGLTRLHEFGYTRLGNINCELQNDNAALYKIKKISVDGLHRIVWRKFYELFRKFDYKSELYKNIYTPRKNQYFESDRRNEINYNPGRGYTEIYQSASNLKKHVKEVVCDSYNETMYVHGEDSSDIDASTQYRIRLLANIISEIDNVNVHRSIVKERFESRKKMILHYEENIKYQKRYLSWLEGN